MPKEAHSMTRYKTPLWIALVSYQNRNTGTDILTCTGFMADDHFIEYATALLTRAGVSL